MNTVDFLVLGGGIAGLSAAARLAEAGQVLLVSKEALAESNTAYAQGGIAVAMGGAEDVALHLEDTIAAGDGLVDRAAAEVLVAEGPARVEELLAWGTAFDRYPGADGELMRTREGAHSLPRILHAHGDATGREIAESLLRHVQTLPNVELLEWTTAVDLIVEDERVVGATLLGAAGVSHSANTLHEVRAHAVLLASGGAGQVYSETTNPAVATGDGIAMAYRAGAAVSDMEFYQFHPTVFAREGAPRFLISEALRGEGALLINASGERFMSRYHPGLELAPRDIVARAITRESLLGPVYLDMRHVTMDLKARFPGISAFLAEQGLALSRDLIPVLPAAHYLMGGVWTDLHGRTTMPGLYAAGEVACTGVHGANRLASNSLLEGLVFGARAAESMKGETAAPGHVLAGAQTGEATDRDAAVWVAELRGSMWLEAGLLRDAAGLRRAEQSLAALALRMPDTMTRAGVEARNLRTVAQLMVQAALGREESRGGHYRNDFPVRSAVAQHSVMERGELRFVEDLANVASGDLAQEEVSELATTR